MIKPNIDVVVNDSCCCAPSTYRTVVLKCNIIGNDNILTQEMISTPLTKYIIKYDYIIDPYPVNGVANIPVTNKIENCCGSDEIIYYSDNFINIPAGKTITIPEDCFLISEPGGRRVNFTVAEQDTLVRIASYTPGVYRYKILKALVLPEKSLIQFDGGSISNGVLIGNNTTLLSFQKDEVILKNIELKGTFTRVFEISEEEVTELPGERIIPVYKKITLRTGRETVSFNVCSFKVMEVVRTVKFYDGDTLVYTQPLAKGENTFTLPTALIVGVNKTLKKWIIDGVAYDPGLEYTIQNQDIDELRVNSTWVCTVTYYNNGDIERIEVTPGTSITLKTINVPEDLRQNRFIGWCTDENCLGEVLSGDYEVTENTNFYAKLENFDWVVKVWKNSSKTEYLMYYVLAGNNTITLPNVNDLDGWYYVSNNNKITLNSNRTWTISENPGYLEIYPILNIFTITWKYGDTVLLESRGKSISQYNLPTQNDFNNSSYVYIQLNGTEKYVIYKKIEKTFNWITNKGEFERRAYVGNIVSDVCWKINNNEIDLTQEINITEDTIVTLSFKNPHFASNQSYSTELEEFKGPLFVDLYISGYTFEGWKDNKNIEYNNFNNITDVSYFEDYPNSVTFTALWNSTLSSTLTLKSFDSELTNNLLNEEYLSNHGAGVEITTDEIGTLIDDYYGDYHYIYTPNEIVVETGILSGGGNSTWDEIQGGSYDSNHEVYIIYNLDIADQRIRFKYK